MYDKIIVLLCFFFALTTQNTEIKIGEKTTFTPTFTKQDFVLKLSSTPITNKYLTFELTPKFDADKGMFYLSQEVESPSELHLPLTLLTIMERTNLYCYLLVLSHKKIYTLESLE